jgi:hypothetical protein
MASRAGEPPPGSQDGRAHLDLPEVKGQAPPPPSPLAARVPAAHSGGGAAGRATGERRRLGFGVARVARTGTTRATVQFVPIIKVCGTFFMHNLDYFLILWVIF